MTGKKREGDSGMPRFKARAANGRFLVALVAMFSATVLGTGVALALDPVIDTPAPNVTGGPTCTVEEDYVEPNTPAPASGTDLPPCLDIDKSASSTSLTPTLAVDVTSSVGGAVGGDALNYTLRVRNTESTLEVSGKIQARNSKTVAQTVASYFDYVEYYSKEELRWVPLGGTAKTKSGYTPKRLAPIGSGMDFQATSEPSSGVSYPQSGDPIVGTVIDPSGITVEPSWPATWNYTAKLELTPEQTLRLLDPAKTEKIRNVVHLETTAPAGGGQEETEARTTTSYFTKQLRTQSGAANDVKVVVGRQSESPLTVDSSSVAALAGLGPGASASLNVSDTASQISTRGQSETDATYLARLQAVDGEDLNVGVDLEAKTTGKATHTPNPDDVLGVDTDPTDNEVDVDPSDQEVSVEEREGQVDVGPDRDLADSESETIATRQLPIVEIAKSGPEQAVPGTALTYDLDLENIGSASAQELKVKDALEGRRAKSSLDAPGTLSSGQTGTGHVSHDVSDSQRIGPLTDTGSVTWQDHNGAEYGPLSDSFTTEVIRSTPGAPPLDPTRSTSLGEATEFLYTGSDPTQEGIAPGTIEEKRAAVVRGQVTSREGEPLAGVRVAVVGHPEFGWAESLLDGSVYMAVNGGGTMTVRLEKDGYIPVERTLDVPWQEWAFFEDAAMVSLLGEPATTVNLGVGSLPQVARGSQESDSDGSRRASVYFPPSTSAELEFADGSSQALSELTLQLAEFTVGESGPEAMPGDLPPTSAYTYAAAFSVQEAESAGAKHVRFSQPVISYTENFVGFPVGKTVPSGYYDQSKSAWIAMQSGRVVKVLSETAGLADLDLTGSGQPANAAALAAAGITDTERANIADLYEPGQSIWRVPLEHFSWVDFNAPGMFPPSETEYASLKRPGYEENSCRDSGSIIECENQVLGEELPLTGSDHSLHYQSNRVPGRRADYRLKIPIAGPTPGSDHIQVTIEVAGRRFTSEPLPPTPNSEYTFEWDGEDAFGRTLTGPQQALIKISYIYEGNYRETSRFGEADGPALSTPMRNDVVVSHDYKETIGTWDARSVGLGGWTLDVHHSYDPVTRTLVFGDGRQKSSASTGLNGNIDTAAGNGSNGSSGDGGLATQAKLNGPNGIDTAPDGSLYIADFYNDRIRKVDPQGTITTIAGTGQGGFSGDGGPATAAKIDGPRDVAVAPDGSLYIADDLNSRIRKISTDGVITTAAGGGSNWADGIPATEATIAGAYGVDVGPDGSLYLTSGYNGGRVRKVDPAGIITKIAGCEAAQCNDQSERALDRFFWGPGRVTVSPDGSVYFVSGTWAGGHTYLNKVTPDGKLEEIVSSQTGFSGDGGPVAQARISANDIEFGPDGALYIAGGQRIRRVDPDGRIDTVAGSGLYGGFSEGGDRGSPLEARFDATDIAFGPSGAMYISSTGQHAVRRVSALLPGFTGGESAIPSEDGSELYRFDRNGRHLRTIDTLTGKIIYSFSYDDLGLLVEVADGDGNVTEIEHDSSGNPTAIVAPFGQSTGLETNVDGYLNSATNPAEEETTAGYFTGGLLERFTDPKDQDTTFTYDSLGRLTRDTDRAGGYKTLDRTDGSKSYEVTKSTRLGRITRYKQERVSSVEQKRTVTSPSGVQSVGITRQNGSRTLTSPDGSVAQSTEGGDPRFGRAAPIDKSVSLTTPGGLSVQTQATRSATLANPDNPLSLTSLTATSTVNGRTSSSTYSAGSRRFTETSAAGRTTTDDIDSQGRPIRTEIPGITPTTFTYDVFGRLSQAQQGTRVWQYSYDEDGYLASTTDPLNRQTSFAYDLAGRVTAESLPGGREVGYAYDVNGNLTSITPPGRSAHAFGNTVLDFTASYAPPSVGDGAIPTQYTYDYDHDVALITRPDGTQVDPDYDSAGRLASVVHPGGTLNYSYDSSDRLSSVSAPGGVGLAFTYDGPIATGETFSGPVSGNVSRTYDNNLRMTEDKVNGANVITYGYEQDDLLTAAGALTLTRDTQNGRLTATSLASTASSVSYNAFGEPASESASYNAAPLLSTTYTRDAGGRIAEKTETTSSGTHTYAYTFDEAGRLTDVTKDGGALSHYAYDQNGNRLSKTSGGITVSATHDAQDRLTAYGGKTYTYTKNGDLRTKTETASGDTTTYDYDALGALTKVTLPSGTVIDYLIDGEGRRVGKKVGGSLTQGFLYGQAVGPLAELDSSGNVKSRFIYATRPNVPDYMTKAGNTYRIVTDQLGSPRLVVNASTGAVAQELDYDEFGNIISDTNPGFQPFGFAGGINDSDAKLVRFGARDYDPETGRWTAKDPIRFGGGDTNLYGYVLGDPVNFIDPEGLLGIPGWLKDAGMKVSNAAAGALNSLTLGLSNRIAGVDGSCAGAGYGLGSILGDLNPRGAFKQLAKVGIKKAAKSEAKLARQMKKRGWTKEMIQEAKQSGRQVRAANKATGNPATRYVHPTTGQSVVIDDVTGEVIQVGGPGFRHGPASGDLP